MSFRGRLTLFFILIVAVPMVAVAFLVTEVAGDSATGKTDAALNEDLEFAQRHHDARVADALEAGERLARDRELRTAIADGDGERIERRLREIFWRAEYQTLTFTPAGETTSVGVIGPGVAPARIDLARPSGSPAGTLTISTTSADELAAEVGAATGEAVVVALEGATPAGTIEIDPAILPGEEAGDVAIGDEDFRAASVELSETPTVRLAVIAPAGSGGFFASRPGVAIALLAFIAVALLSAVVIVRTLQGQVASMLAAARKIGDGDFSGEVPVIGEDELAGLASEFNQMRDRLADQVGQLQRQRSEIEASVDRIGQAFASGLDRHGMLEILIETAVGASEAEYGLIALAGHAGDEVEYGTASEELREVALAAEHRALREHGAVSADREGSYALASSLGMARGSGDPIGAMTIARHERAFTPSEQSVFLYLVGQAGASVENLALHELVSEQAVTDELTGLPNNRAFHASIQKEAARAARFRHDLSLLICDIDDFKLINDTYGHLQGDAVLRTIGAILDAESRGIDEPARYGGEEFMVALPETDLDGAREVGERIREAIASAAIPVVGGKGEIKVTASFGAATMPGSGHAADELIAAADAALYAAKRAGKNRIEVAQGNEKGWRTVAE